MIVKHKKTSIILFLFMATLVALVYLYAKRAHYRDVDKEVLVFLNEDIGKMKAYRYSRGQEYVINGRALNNFIDGLKVVLSNDARVAEYNYFSDKVFPDEKIKIINSDGRRIDFSVYKVSHIVRANFKVNKKFTEERMFDFDEKTAKSIFEICLKADVPAQTMPPPVPAQTLPPPPSPSTGAENSPTPPSSGTSPATDSPR